MKIFNENEIEFINETKTYDNKITKEQENGIKECLYFLNNLRRKRK